MSRLYTVVWTRTAENDLEGVIDFIAGENPENARKILRYVKRKASTLKKNPHRGRKIPEFSEFQDLAMREIILPPWRLMYRIVRRAVEVLAFLDSRRDLEELLYQRLVDSK